MGLCGSSEQQKHQLSQPHFQVNQSSLDAAQKDQKRHLLKVILLGDSGVGKSSLIGQFCNREFHENYKATIGADFMTKELQVGDRSVTLQIWDTAGQERFHSLGIAFYRGADACVLVYSLDQRESLKNLQRWKDEFLVQTSMDPKRFPFLVLGNKVDVAESDRVVNVDEAIDWCKESGHVAHFLTSAKDGTNIERAFSIVVNRALENQLNK